MRIPEYRIIEVNSGDHIEYYPQRKLFWHIWYTIGSGWFQTSLWRAEEAIKHNRRVHFNKLTPTKIHYAPQGERALDIIQEMEELCKGAKTGTPLLYENAKERHTP